MDEGYFLFSIFILFNKKPLVVHTTNGFILSRYLRAVRPLPQNSTKAKKLGEGRAARKCPIGEG